MKHSKWMILIVILIVLLISCLFGCSVRNSEPQETKSEKEELFERLDTELQHEDGSFGTYWLDKIYTYYTYLQMAKDCENRASLACGEYLSPRVQVSTYELEKKYAEKYRETADDCISELIKELKQQELIENYYGYTIMTLIIVKTNYDNTGAYLQEYLQNHGYEFPIHTGF